MKGGKTFELNKKSTQNIISVAEKHREYEVIKDITYYFIELPKFRKSKPKLANMLECWLTLKKKD